MDNPQEMVTRLCWYDVMNAITEEVRRRYQVQLISCGCFWWQFPGRFSLDTVIPGMQRSIIQEEVVNGE